MRFYMKKLVVMFPLIITTLGMTLNASGDTTYQEVNEGHVSFDVSMPIDATGFTLKGHHLTGGPIKFVNHGKKITPLLAQERSNFQLPEVTSLKNKPILTTNIKYQAIKLINPNGIGNWFIKVGLANRTEKTNGLDPFVLKDGTYTWKVPVFSVGMEKNNINKKSENWQFLQVGTGKGPSHHNGMYTMQFYINTLGKGSVGVFGGHPQRTDLSDTILSKPYTVHFNCVAHGIWGGGGSDPYRTIRDKCKGSTVTFPAGPNLDYEYGSYQLPTVLSPWTAGPNRHCIIDGKRKKGCTNIEVASTINYIAQKIRVPLKNHVVLTAAAGSLYRQMNVHNLTYQCGKGSNVYLDGLIPKKDCFNKNYLPGGWSGAYFSVGFELQSRDGVKYIVKYVYTPEKENADRFAWRDASSTTVYIVTTSHPGKAAPTAAEIQKHLQKALSIIEQYPAIDKILGQHFFKTVLEKNNISTKPVKK